MPLSHQLNFSSNALVVFAFTASALVFSTLAAHAQKAAVSRPYKVGYFNLTMVKLACPEAAGSEALRVQAEAQLRRDAEEGNKRVEKAQADKIPQEDLRKLVVSIQTELNAKQQALAQLVQSSTAQANEKIARAVNAVAREQNLDLVVDGAGVFAGGQQVLESGVDITSDTIKKLQPELVLRNQDSTSRPPASAPSSAPKKSQ